MSRPVPSPRRRRATRCLAALLAVAATVPALLASTASPAAAAGTVSLSKSTGISLSGESITVSGSGFDSSGTRGIYVMFCQQTAGRPTGADCNGSQQWVTSRGFNGSTAWSGAGAFTTTVEASSAWEGVDCTQVTCGVVTRNDHFESGQSDQDSFTPVTFAVPPEETTTTTTEAEAPAESSTTTTTAPVSANATRIALTKSTDLAGGEVITVTGEGFVADQGIYVQVCAAPEGALGTAAGRATACYPEQDGERTVWITPVPAGGRWSTPLTVSDEFGDVDCREQQCGVFVRRDHSGGATDFSQDAFAPISFGEGTDQPTDPNPVGARLSVSPAGAIVSGSTITVDGAGFRAGHELFVGVCDMAVANFAGCDFGNVEQVTVEHGGTARAGGPGTFTTQLVARAEFGTTDCRAAASRCAVATWAVSGNDEALEAQAEIRFAGSSAAPGTPARPGAAPSSPSGAPLARTGAESTRLALIGTLALVTGGALFALGRRRMA